MVLSLEFWNYHHFNRILQSLDADFKNVFLVGFCRFALTIIAVPQIIECAATFLVMPNKWHKRLGFL